MTELANLTEEMVMTAKVEDLKEILRRRGLDITGRKTDLQDRAKDWLKANPKVSDVTTSPANGSGEVVDGAYGGQEETSLTHPADNTVTVDYGPAVRR